MINIINILNTILNYNFLVANTYFTIPNIKDNEYLRSECISEMSVTNLRL